MAEPVGQSHGSGTWAATNVVIRMLEAITPMVFRGRLSEEACAAVEAAQDELVGALDDWSVSLRRRQMNHEEVIRHQERLHRAAELVGRAVTITADLDEALALSVTLLRTGPTSPHTRRLRAERAERTEGIRA